MKRNCHGLLIKKIKMPCTNNNNKNPFHYHYHEFCKKVFCGFFFYLVLIIFAYVCLF